MDRDERYLEQSIEMGFVQFIQEGRYRGRLEDLGQCPTPQEKTPKIAHIWKTTVAPRA